MFIATFYSFKGGVGRTMAAVNSGVELARRGKKVLLVDFDLEAPGLSTYRQLQHDAGIPGIIEYVHEYMTSGQAPDAAGHMAECRLGEEISGSVWVMPAGRRNADYGRRFAHIDWQVLYEQHEGYLLFEDLKEQWRQVRPGFDYVIIDSRTGHTDVGGICTRQLPDAVVLLFVPNEQNIEGLATVVDEIRADGDRRQKNKRLLFCPSNVPNLDDEHEILKGKLEQAKRAFNARGFAATIRHYDSLSLLDQSIFVVDRCGSRLAEEYRRLADALARLNLGDREGVLSRLDEHRATLTDGRRRNDGSVGDLVQELGQTTKLHPRDGDIALRLAMLYRLLGRLDSEYEALTTAVDYSPLKADALNRRALNLLSRGKRDEAVRDLSRVLHLDDVDGVRLLSALELLRFLDEDVVVDAAGALVNRPLAPHETLPIIDVLMTDYRTLDTALTLSQRVLASDASAEVKAQAASYQVLTLIGDGRFGDAMRALAPSRSAARDDPGVQAVFNYAMAECGEPGAAPADLFGQVLAMAPNAGREMEANFCQCVSIAAIACGDKDAAHAWLTKARLTLPGARMFSAWRYLSVDPSDMVEDLDDQGRFIDRGIDGPLVLRRQAERTMYH